MSGARVPMICSATQNHCKFRGGITMNFPSRLVSAAVAFLLVLGFGWQAANGQQSSSQSSDQTQAGAAGDRSTAGQPAQTIVIPGPLRSLLRMTGLSQEAPPKEILPLMARNAFLYGHVGPRRTEYLVLADRYVHQARELEALAGPDGKIHVSGCGDAVQLIQILGYRFENGCGPKDASLVTADAERAFVTVDSGFPLTQLEQALQEGTPFSYDFPSSRVPILFSEKDWVALVPSKERGGTTLLDLLMNDQNVDRLYSALARLDPETQQALLHEPGLKRLLAYSPILDFYGSRICIRSGAVELPGGTAAEHAWAELVGANPASSGDFVYHLIAKDQGWLASYFDALSRVAPEQQAHLVAGQRLKRLYDAYKSSLPNVSAGTSVFPKNASLLLLFMRLQWDTAGEPLVPGDPHLWEQLFAQVDRTSHLHGRSRFDRDASNADRLLETLVAYSNLQTTDGPVQVYLALSAIDSGRPPEKHLSADAMRMLATRYGELSDWYPIFVEFSALDGASITHFIQTVDHLNGISNPALRSNAMGAFQAEVGIWQILARQQQISDTALRSSWEAAIQPYAGLGTSNQLFDAARKSLQSLLTAAGAKGNATQDEVVDLLAGPAQNNPDGMRVHQEIARRMRTVLDDQRLVSLDTLFGLYDGLGQMAHGAAIGDSLLPLAGALREFEMPRPIFTEGERVSWSPVVYVSRHAELQVRTDLTKVIKTPGTPAQLEAARARLAPFLRDTLVGLNYAYYEPPGAQVLHSNPLFVRSHDFAGASIQGISDVWGEPMLIGIGATAGGGAYLIGSLADLPYVLALTEEDFISPEKIQALIWRETVPELLINAVLPRWWNVTPNELHAADLYQRGGEELLRAAATHADLRREVEGIFSDRVSWARADEIDQALQQEDSAAALAAHLLPCDVFYLEAGFRKLYPGDAAQWGPANKQLDELVSKDPAETSPQRLAGDFGAPHPTLADSNSRALITSEPFPVSGGYGSRLFGESWESNNLYWARLADEKGYPPVMLNVLIPELTRQMIANISATSIDDWPALLRAMRQTGDEFLEGKITIHTASPPSANQNVANGGTQNDE